MSGAREHEHYHLHHQNHQTKSVDCAAMGYKWEQHRATCYRLYVNENRPLDEVVQYMRDHHNFTPRCFFPFSLASLPHPVLMLLHHPIASALPYCIN